MLAHIARSMCRGASGMELEAIVSSAFAPLHRRSAVPLQCVALFASAPSSTSADVDARCNAINDAFSQAREDIADARDDAETVYFNESAQAARESVAGVLSQWSELLQSVGDQQRGELQRSMGLKMEQLKAELKELDDLHA